VPEPKRAAKNIKNAKRGSPKLLTEPRIMDSFGTVRSDLSASHPLILILILDNFLIPMFFSLILI